MRRFRILLLSCVVFTMIAFTGCEAKQCPQIGYYIGQRYNFEDSDVQVDLNETEEEFIFDYIDKDSTSVILFETIFNYDTIMTLRNSPEFDYIDENGKELVFDENGYYAFEGNKIIHIVYKHANNEIKSAIATGDFSVSFGFGSFQILKPIEEIC